MTNAGAEHIDSDIFAHFISLGADGAGSYSLEQRFRDEIGRKTMTLTEFLEARISEREAAAQAADWAMQGVWYTEADDKVDEYVRLMSPREVLAECAAKRAIIAEYARYHAERRRAMNGWVTEGDSAILKFLALPYAEHSDYDETWRP